MENAAGCACGAERNTYSMIVTAFSVHTIKSNEVFITMTRRQCNYRSEEYLKEMKDYLKHLKEENNVEEAIEGLKRTGVLDENGNPKKQIVTRI